MLTLKEIKYTAKTYFDFAYVNVTGDKHELGNKTTKFTKLQLKLFNAPPP